VLGRVAFRGVVAACEIGALPGAALHIGNRVFINQGATIVATDSITIGDDCRIGDYVAVYDSDYHPLEEGRAVNTAPVTIGRNVWLARNVIVLPGARIGEHSVIAAGSVVRGEIPPRVLAAGNPAAAVRELRVGEAWRRP
jgi:acetyltransferase-like isoleucine patch superfamily enzyme